MTTTKFMSLEVCLPDSDSYPFIQAQPLKAVLDVFMSSVTLKCHLAAVLMLAGLPGHTCPQVFQAIAGVP